MRELDDLVIQLFADRELTLLDRIAALEDECAALRRLAQARGDTAATLKSLVLQAWARLYELEGDADVINWEQLEPDILTGWHRPPQSLVARLRRCKRTLEAQVRRQAARSH